MEKIKINNRIISEKKEPFIVAEMSGNHNLSLSRAFKIIDKAAMAGVDAIKLQTYTPDTITIKSNRKEFLIKDKKNLWKNNTLHELYKKGQTPWKWHKKLFSYAKKKKLICFSSPFDETAVDFLEKLGTPAYKIASFENDHYPLLKKVAKTGKPMIISIGLLKLKELKDIIKFIKKNGCKNFALLKCTSTYPANYYDLNLKTILDLKKRFKCPVGFSDHSKGTSAALTAISFGACIIEKHFTLDQNDEGVDSKFSLTPYELRQLKKDSITAWQSAGKVSYGATKNERTYTKYKRSIYVIKNLKKGETFNSKNLKIIRPNKGLHPKFYDKLLGKKSSKNLKYGTPFKFEFIN